MVSLESQSKYLSQALKNEKLSAFHSLLLGEELDDASLSQDLNEIDRVYFGLIKALIRDSRKDFLSNFDTVSRRKPGNNSPFIHNDLLIFTLILGLTKYGLPNDWMNSVLEKRTNSKTTTTFNNLLNRNYLSKSNIPEIVLVFNTLLDNQNIEDEIIDESVKSVRQNNEVFNSQDDFRALIALKAFDVMMTIREVGASGEYALLKSFEKKFKKRVNLMSQVIYLAFLVVALFFFIKWLNKNPDFKNLLGDVNTILGILGLALSSLFAVFRKRVEKLLLKFFGYTSKEQQP